MKPDVVHDVKGGGLGNRRADGGLKAERRTRHICNPEKEALDFELRRKR